jgi:hypothetical protein
MHRWSRIGSLRLRVIRLEPFIFRRKKKNGEKDENMKRSRSKKGRGRRRKDKGKKQQKSVFCGSLRLTSKDT